MKKAKYVITKTASGYHANLQAKNGKVIASASATRLTRHECEADIDNCRNAEEDDIEVVRQKTGDQYKFKVRNKATGKSSFKSELYKTKFSAQNGRIAVLNCKDTEIVVFNNLTDAPE